MPAEPSIIAPQVTPNSNVVEVLQIAVVELDPAICYYRIPLPSGQTHVSQLFDSGATHIPQPVATVSFENVHRDAVASYTVLPELSALPNRDSTSGPRRRRNFTDILEP